MNEFSCDMGFKTILSNALLRRGSSGLSAALLLACAVLWTPVLPAQQDESNAAGTAELSAAPALPGVRHLAASLSDPASRQDSLLTLAALARLFDKGSLASPEQVADWEARFRDDRAWLDRLLTRYTRLPIRTPVLDPAAWALQVELDQQSLDPGPLASPLGPDQASVLRQLFDRGDERLAAALLPEVLFRLEARSTTLWAGLSEQAPTSPALASLLNALNADWFDPWGAAEPPSPDTLPEDLEVNARALQYLEALASGVIAAGPPDELGLKRLRFSLLENLPAMADAQRAEAARLLALAAAFDGLRDGAYLAFNETLLWVASDLLLNTPPAEGEALSAIPRWLAGILPATSNAFSGAFGEVDPRINSNLAAVFDVMQYLQAGERQPARLASLRQEIADAVAQLVLLVPDLNYYFEQPVRARIAEELDICISIVASRDAPGVASLTREQFDGCLRSLVDMANEQVRSAELAGDPDGPFGTEQLRRELALAPWQRVNYVLGYLHDQHAAGCEAPAEPLPNPLEWSHLAATVVWLAEQAPVFMQTPENEARISGMRDRGLRLVERWVQQIDCISGAGTGINDPVSRGLAEYRRALDGLVADLRAGELAFRAERLKPGADVVLHGDAGQRTAFRTEGLQILPCDSSRICEMAAPLESTRALIGLFPDTYLIADQTGLGEVEICYDNVQWVERRSVPVRADDPHVANYFGHLSFDLVGRYRESGETSEVFGFNFVSPEEYHYLFAAATEEVLNDACPVEWVGSKIVTRIGGEARLRVVPDRLTYLAAARSQPSQVITANWNRNQEWRDRFVTGLDVTTLPTTPGRIDDRVSRHLQALYQAGQAALYDALLQPGQKQPGGGPSLYERLEELTARKALVRSYVNLFYPQSPLDSDAVRAGLEGRGSLLDRAALKRFREANVAVSAINETGVARLERFQALWGRQPESLRRTGSSGTGLAHAITRLNSLYTELYVSPRRPPAATAAVTVAEAGDG